VALCALIVPGVSRPIAECAATAGEYPDKDGSNKAVARQKSTNRTPLRNVQILPATSTWSHPMFWKEHSQGGVMASAVAAQIETATKVAWS